MSAEVLVSDYTRNPRWQASRERYLRLDNEPGTAGEKLVKGLLIALEKYLIECGSVADDNPIWQALADAEAALLDDAKPPLVETGCE